MKDSLDGLSFKIDKKNLLTKNTSEIFFLVVCPFKNDGDYLLTFPFKPITLSMINKLILNFFINVYLKKSV